MAEARAAGLGATLQPHLEGGTSFTGHQRQLTAERHDPLAGDREAEAGTADVARRGEEAVEDAADVALRDADTVVADVDDRLHPLGPSPAGDRPPLAPMLLGVL